jgi:fibronectin-binding autotransporter adhesin
MFFKKSSQRKRLLFGIGLISLIPLQSATAASLTWSAGGGADLLWTNPANWTPAGPPTVNDDAIFSDTAIVADNATINNSIGASITVHGLTYKNNSGFHNTSLASGASLTINSAGTGVVFGIGSETSPAAVQSENTTISGAGSIVVNAPTADIVVRQGSSASSGSSKATLNLSGVDSFTADVAHLWVGVANPPGYTSANRNTGTLYLAKTNSIRASVSTAAAPGIDVGKSTSNNGGGSFLFLGIENTLNADMLGFGRVKENGVSMLFNPDFTATGEAHAKFRAANGTDRVVNWTIGDGVTDTATTSVRGTNDFTGGSVDAMVDTMVIARTSSGGTGNVVHKGMLTFEKGTIDVNTLRIAVQATTAEASGRSGDGTVNVNGQANLIVNTALEMGVVGNALSPGAALTVANLNVNGGTVTAPGITTYAASTAKVVVTNGKLILNGDTAVAGTLEAPIDELSLSGATVEMTGGNARIVAGTLNPGEPSSIKITGLPVISSYPATLKLIQFTSASAALNFTLAGLPAGFVGTLMNNDAGSSVDLQLTSGPVPSILTWNGGVSADWDFTTQNWLKGATASLYADGDAVVFNDTATGSASVNLTTALKPGEINVNNSTKAYTFLGAGKIGGTATLVKNGSGTLTIANSGTNDFVGGVTILGGTVQVGNGGAEGNLPTGAIVNNSSLVYKVSGNVTVTDAITGTGSVSQEGSGTLTLAGANGYTGGTVANSGTLVVNGPLPGTTGVTVGAGGTLGGSATLTAPVLVTGTIDPGNGTTTATLTTGPLTLNAGAKLKFDLSGDPAGTANDQLVVHGVLVANNNEITINFLGTPALDTPYTLISYTGAKIGNLNATVTGTHYTAALNQSINGTVTVTLSGAGSSLKWNSTTSAILDNTSLNWLKTGGGLDAFFSGDAMLFDDSVAGVQTALTIPAGVWLAPSSITVNGGLDYSITGSGKITGSTGVTKNGTGTLTLGGTANDYSGVVNVNAGTLKAGSASALGGGGMTSGNTVISSGATLDLAGFQLNGESITVSGSGQANVGAIVNSGAQQINGVGRVTLAGNVTFGGTGRWDLRGGGATLSSEGNAYTITKVGTNQISFVAATIDQGLGDIDIKEGVFAIQTTTVQTSGGFGDPSKTITIHNGGTLNVYNLGANSPLNKKIVVETGGTIWNENSVSVLSGEINLLGDANVNAGGTSLSLDGVVSGAGGINKIGGSALILNAANTYTGKTTVNSGALQLTDTGSLSTSATVDVRSGASINVSGRTDATLTLASGQTLTGSGTITGNLVASAGSTVSPGPATGVGTLAVTGDANLQGTTAIMISGNTNDVIKAANVTLGGVLNIAVTGSLPAGATFKIVDAASISGAFTAIVPATPGVGQTWDTANLLVDGTLKVVGDAVGEPTITTAAIVGANVQLTGNGGTAGASYSVLASSDITAAVSNWAVVSSGNFGANGEFSANIAKGAESQRFYIIKMGGN